MRALKVVEQIAEPEISEAESWNGRLQMALLASNGIPKLRELILELAMRGKLVPQNHKDETAQKLLERISKEKGALLKNKKAKKLQSDLDEPYSIPDNWAWVHFSDIAQHNSGKTLDKGRNTGVLREYITTSNLYWGRFALENVREMPIKDSEIEKCTARKNDLLICEGGEAGRAAVWPYDREVCFQNHVHRARFYCDVNPYFLYRFFEKINTTGEINAYRKGVGISNMSGKSLGSIILPLPPINEQVRIVEKINELMALCDKLEAQKTDATSAHEALVKTLLGTLTQSQNAKEFQENWQRIAKNFNILFTTEASIDALKKTILQLAVMGKLVPQDPNDEPAEKFLKRIKLEKEKPANGKKLKKDNISPKVSDEEKAFGIPSTWAWTRFSTVAEIRSELVRSQDFLSAYQVAPDNIEKGTGKLLSKRTVKESGVVGPNNRFYSGQILYSKIRPSLSKAILVDFDGLCSADMYPIITKLFSKFLLLQILSEHFLSQVRKAENRVKMPKLNQESLSLFTLVVPPIEEQKRIVSEVDELFEICDTLKMQLKRFNSTHEHLANALVEKAVAA